MIGRSLTSCLLALMLAQQATGQNNDETPGPSDVVEQETPSADPWGDDWGDDWGDAWEEEKDSFWHGFAEWAMAVRLDRDPALEQRRLLAEVRLRLEADRQWKGLDLGLKLDLWRDEVLDETAWKFREASISFSPWSGADVTLGRQVLTWGTGDLVFVNDLFPKGFSYFAGRDDEYLKVPSDALRFSQYNDWFNVDLVIMPEFTADEFLSGERFSFYQPSLGGIGVPAQEPDLREPSGSDYALRLHRLVGAAEWAIYGYDGHFLQPSRQLDSGVPGFAPLEAIGASLRQPWFGGIAYVEGARYRSTADRNGDDPVIPNDIDKLLLGFERELATNLTLNVQYLHERTRDYAALLRTAPDLLTVPDENRQLWTGRLTYRTRQDRLVWSLFAYHSPSDDDYHFRPQISYRQSDRWQWAAGANLFGGRRPHTFLARLEDNSSLFARLRLNF